MDGDAGSTRDGGGLEEAAFIVQESGRVRFFVRPRVEVAEVTTQLDVQRLMMLLVPRGGQLGRRIVIGKKRLPDLERRERRWGYVDRVGDLTELVADLGARSYVTKTRGVRRQAEAVIVARGRYAIASHRDHVHLLYELDASARDEPTPLLHELRVLPRASYVATAFDPAAKGRRPQAQPDEDLPPFSEPSPHDDAEDALGGRRFAALTSSLLDVVGTEIVLIGTPSPVRWSPERSGVGAGCALSSDPR